MLCLVTAAAAALLLQLQRRAVGRRCRVLPGGAGGQRGAAPVCVGGVQQLVRQRAVGITQELLQAGGEGRAERMQSAQRGRN